MSYSSFKIILIHVKNIIPIITATLILNYLNNSERSLVKQILIEDEIIVCATGNDSNLLIVFYVQIMPDDFVMQLHRF